MKKQMPPTRPKVAPPIEVRHQLEHEVPTVIHHPEDDMTALGRLTYHVLQDPRKYSTWVLAFLLGILALVVVLNFSSGGRAKNSEAWNKLEAATKAEQRVEVAKEFPTSPVSSWALLQAATEYHNLALADLPNNKDVALPLFKKSLDLFDKVAREAPKDSFQARAAIWGKARSLEARNDLPEAIAQYELVAKNWPGSPEADQAKQMIEALKDPAAASFYKELYTYAPTKVTLPPLGAEDVNLPPTGVNLGLPGAAKTTVPPLPTPMIKNISVEPAPAPAPEKSKPQDTKPEPATAPAPAPAPTPAQPAAKSDTATTPAKKADLPLEVLKPTDGAPKAKPPQ